MRKIIIDTDMASDDAAAIMMAALDSDVEVLGVTVVSGSTDLHQTTKNALMVLEVCDCHAPVFQGAEKPLLHEKMKMISVHGKDNMGDCGIINPIGAAEKKPAFQFILDMVSKYPDEVELVTLGHATNVALAIAAAPQIMKRVKRIWSMGTPGLGVGNVTPVAECNVYMDAESYKIMLDSGLSITIIGFDLCLGENALYERDLRDCACGNQMSQFLEQATKKLLAFNLQTQNCHMVNLPDAVAMACVLWPEFMVKTTECFCKVCTVSNETYGQVIFYQKGATYESSPVIKDYNVTLVRDVQKDVFTKKFMELLLR
jgi:purine nucleosidase